MGNGSSAANKNQSNISVDEGPFLQRHLRLKQQKSSNSSEEEFQSADPSRLTQQLPQNKPQQFPELQKEPPKTLFARRNSHPETGKTVEAQRAKRALRRKSSKSDEYAGDTDEEVDELETTLNSLGVVGKSLWEDAQAYESMKANNRKNDVRINNRDSVGQRQHDEYYDDEEVEDEFDSSTISRELPARRIGASSLAKGRRIGGRRPTKTFQYSWEKNGIKEDEVGDEWEYKGNKIEGVDIEKFKAVNSKNTNKPNTTKMEAPSSFLPAPRKCLPQASPEAASGASIMSTSRETSTTLTTIPDYDETDAKLLASIEDEFVY